MRPSSDIKIRRVSTTRLKSTESTEKSSSRWKEQDKEPKRALKGAAGTTGKIPREGRQASIRPIVIKRVVSAGPRGYSSQGSKIKASS